MPREPFTVRSASISWTAQSGRPDDLYLEEPRLKSFPWWLRLFVLFLAGIVWTATSASVDYLTHNFGFSFLCGGIAALGIVTFIGACQANQKG